MKGNSKTEQLQIRVSPAQKRAIQERARRAGTNMSDWILSRALPTAQQRFQDLISELADSAQPGFAFAELLDLLGPMSADAFESAVSEPPQVELGAYWMNYLAATVERAAVMKHARSPGWTRDVVPLAKPSFGSSLKSLRLHLLVNSPPSFIERNIFIDANVGDRV